MLERAAEEKVLRGQKDIEAYRRAHTRLHSGAWHTGVPEGHVPLLKTLIAALEKSGFVSAEPDFEAKKNEVLAMFFTTNEQLNVQALGFADREDFFLKAAEATLEESAEMWA